MTAQPPAAALEAASRGSARRVLLVVASVLLVGWLAVGAFGGPAIGELSSVASNDSADYLPASSESARVQHELSAFRPKGTGETLPAVVVAERDGGITDADQAFLARVLTGASGGQPGIGNQAVTVSADGLAAQAVAQVPATDGARKEVQALRAKLMDAPAGLTVLVTGPAGQIADLVEAFSGIDGLLLLVAGGVVALILLLVYRGPLLVLIVLASAVLALALAALIVYHLAKSGAVQLNGQSQGILFILVFGAATDYALLLVSRYRQQLREHRDRVIAMRSAWRATFAPITASAGTVILGVLCLLFSDLTSNRGLGPVAAIGIAAAWLASMTFLPATLMLLGRAPFWPLIPRTGSAHPETGGLWGRVSRGVDAHPRRVWIVTAIVLAGCAVLVPQLRASGTAQSDVFLSSVDSVRGQEALDAHFPGGTGSPTVIVADADRADAVAAAARVDGVASVTVLPGRGGGPLVADGRAQIAAVLTSATGSQASLATVQRIRDAVHAVAGADALVGGQSALQLDTNLTSERDRTVIIPIVLLVVFAVLALLLRALLAPLVLIATVVLSFAATLGVSAMVFNHLFGFPGADPAVPLFAFVFLVALGIDYNIFLMTRVREEAVRHGTRRGTVRGLALTGGVITSAGVVLAATFSALAVLPILFLAQIAFLVAFGVLLDTLVVRSLLVPALTIDIGRRIWWPSRLSRTGAARAGEADARGEETGLSPAIAPPATGSARDGETTKHE
jgi:RND superfamily putative drug exporter